MSFRSKLALGFAGILALLLTAAGFLSLRNVNNLSNRLRSSFVDSVVPLRNAQLADQAFDHVEIQLLAAVLETGSSRDNALKELATEQAKFEKIFEEYEAGATHEPAMQEILARYGALDDQTKRQGQALAGIKADYPLLKTHLSTVVNLLQANKQSAAEEAYRKILPLFTRIDSNTNALMVLEVEQGGYLNTESQAVAQSAKKQVPLIAGTAVMLGILLVLVVARSFTEPLIRLTAAAQKVSAGDLEQVVPVESRDEVGQLALAFNTMTDSLRTARTDMEGRVEARTRELAAANELLNSQMAERERAAEALRQAKDVAEAANRAKSEFLAKMSHEIRTPMNGVMGAVDLVLETQLRPEQREYLQIASTSAESLLHVINDILDFSRVESGKLQLEPVEFHVRRWLDDALIALRVRADQKHLELRSEVSPDIPEVVIGDPGRLRQIVTNLVGNAIKFTESGFVCVQVTQQRRDERDSELRFTISDTGIGIPVERQNRIFDAFEQADGSITRKYGGTGLGLAISAQLVDIMGGRLWVQSEVNEGSTFNFVVPVGVAERRREENIADHASFENPTLKLVSNKRAHSSFVRQMPSLKVLLAEDNVVNQKIASGVLKNWGHTIEVACNGREALEKLRQNCFDLVLMDVQMPDMDGYETTKAIRQQEIGTGRHIPIVAVTAHAMESDYQRCLDAGMDGYVSKPLRIEELFKSIQHAVFPRAEEGTIAQSTSQNASVSLLDSSEEDRVNASSKRLQLVVREPNDTREDTSLDSSAFECIEYCENSGMDVGEVLTAFLSDTMLQLNALKNAVNESDCGALKHISHYLKGSAMLIGARSMVNACRKFERELGSGSLAHVRKASNSLVHEAVTVCAAVECHLAEIRPSNSFGAV